MAATATQPFGGRWIILKGRSLYVMPDVDIKSLFEFFRATVLKHVENVKEN